LGSDTNAVAEEVDAARTNLSLSSKHLASSSLTVPYADVLSSPWPAPLPSINASHQIGAEENMELVKDVSCAFETS
jgi:hypothetical protein